MRAARKVPGGGETSRQRIPSAEWGTSARAHFDASQPTEKKYNNFNVLLRQQPKRKNLLFPSFPPPLPTRCKSPFQSLVIIQPEWGGGLLDCIKQVLVMHNFFSLSPYIHSRWWLFRDVYVTGGSIARFFFQTNFKLGCLLVRKKRVFFFHSFNWALQMLHFPLIREFRIRFFFSGERKTNMWEEGRASRKYTQVRD